MGSPIQRRWPKNAESARKTTYDLAGAAIEHLMVARDTLDKREHPALTAIEIADAMRLLETIRRLMNEAKNGIE